MFFEKLIKSEIRNLSRQRETLDDRNEYLRLDKNERLLPFDLALFEEFKQSLKSEDLSAYCELTPLKRKLARYLGVAENQILMSAGSDLAIKSVFEACVEAGDNIVLHSPSYAMYRVYGTMFGADNRMIPIKSDWSIDFDRMLDAVDIRTKFVAIESPNGFVGTKPNEEDLINFSRKLYEKNTLLIIDEAYFYIENEGCSSHKFIYDCQNVVITQTFSKGHGLAGVRFGYLIGDSRLIEYLGRVSPMHEISSLAACAVHWVLGHDEMLTEYQQSLNESKRYLKERLTEINVPYRDTHANFMLLYLPEDGRSLDLRNRLRDKKVLIRRPFEEEFLSGWIRICVGSRTDSERFCDELARIIGA